MKKIIISIAIALLATSSVLCMKKEETEENYFSKSLELKRKFFKKDILSDPELKKTTSAHSLWKLRVKKKIKAIRKIKSTGSINKTNKKK